MEKTLLFIDGSYNPETHIGFGAYLMVHEPISEADELKEHIKVKRFDDTSSTQLELKNLLWALSHIEDTNHKIMVYTDSQNIIDLPRRRLKLEQQAYITKKNTLLRNYKLYQEFYQLIDLMDCTFIKIKGHLPTGQKKKIDRLFSYVDKASRNAMRNKN